MERSLYKGVSSPPKMDYLLNRPQVDSLLEQACERPLITVTAGAGFGKTQAVSAFLRQRGARVIWLQLSTMDNLLSRFWEHLVYSFSVHNEDLGTRMQMLGFPENIATMSNFIRIIADESDLNGEYFIVFDDFHNIYEKKILYMIEELVNARIEGLTIILLSRTDPELNIIGLVSKGLLACITEDHLRFSLDEMIAYFESRELRISADALNDIYEIIAGWVFAVYLVGLTLKPGVVYEKIPISLIKFDIFKLIETEIFNDQSHEMKMFLIKISLVDVLRIELLRDIASDNVELINKIVNFKSFIHFDVFDNCYHIHALFLDFLRDKQALLSHEELQEVYSKIAGWCESSGNIVDAVNYYEKAEIYEKVIENLAKIFTSEPSIFVINILDKIPDEIHEKMPILSIVRAKNLIFLFRFEEALAILNKMIADLSTYPLEEEHRSYMGEIYCVLGFINLITSLTDRDYQFVNYFRLADEYLPCGSTLFDKSLHFNKGTYASMVSVGHYKEGFLDQYIEAMSTAMPYASRVMNGSGSGAEYLVMTETAYFRRDFKSARTHAQQAIYRSQEKEQYDIQSMAIFYLVRVHIALGDYAEVISLLERLKTYAERHNDVETYAILQIAEGWFYATIGQTSKVSAWILRETEDYSDIKGISFCLYRLVRAKCHLAQKNYYEILAFSEQQNDPYGLQNFLIGAIETKTIRAVALYLLGEKSEALDVLEEVYTLAQPNGLIMPFIEQGTHMRTMTQAALNSNACSIPRVWLENIHIKSSSYAKKLNRIMADYQATQRSTPLFPNLTQREVEILSNLCSGLTREEIAVECNLSVNTIKSMLQNIFKKLGATNGYDAIRIASKMNLPL